MIAKLAWLIIAYSFVVALKISPANALPSARSETRPCERIASLAPSLSALLKELNLDQRIIGASRYDPFIEDSARRVFGGYQDTKVDSLIKVNPSIVFGLKEHQTLLNQANQFGITSLSVDHNKLSSYLDSIVIIGQACGIEKIADQVAQKKRSFLERVKHRYRSYPVESVLAIYLQEGQEIETAFALGQNSFISDLLPFFKYSNWLKSNSHMLRELKSSKLLKDPPHTVFAITSFNGNQAAGGLTPRQLELLQKYPGLSKARIVELNNPGFTYPGLYLEESLKELENVRDLP